MQKTIEIAPGFTEEDWKKLNLSDVNSPDWNKAIKIFKKRINHRFLKFVEKIEKNIYSGFIIMAIDCLLIETLQQFYKGEKETPYRKSKEYFLEFFKNSVYRGDFDENMVALFYDQFRCGILHQAELKGNSRIRIDVALVQYTNDKSGLVINRRLFHKKLVEEFELYLKRLLDPNESQLRVNFRKKMDHICRTDILDN